MSSRNAARMMHPARHMRAIDARSRSQSWVVEASASTMNPCAYEISLAA